MQRISRACRPLLERETELLAVDDALSGPAAAARHLLETHTEGDSWVVQQLRAAAAETLRAGAPDAARSYLARALSEPPPPAERAAVLYELGCSSLLTEPATTVNHLRAALEEPIDDPVLREGIVFRLSQALAHSDRPQVRRRVRHWPGSARRRPCPPVRNGPSSWRRP
jgi:hypothetical protein